MSRYINELPCGAAPQPLQAQIHSYLLREGYRFQEFEGEQVYKKGVGMVSAPTFIKLSYLPGLVRVEAWIKTAILPGVYAGESAMDTGYGFAAKLLLRDRVAAIESMIREAAQPSAPAQGAFAAYGSPVPPQPAPVQGASCRGGNLPSAAAPAQPRPRFCSRCGAPLDENANFCAGCGAALR